MTSQQHTSKFRRFLQLDIRDKRLLLSAVGRLLVARIQLAATPFARLAETPITGSGVTSSEIDAELLARIGFAVRAAANNVPWRSDCFPQAIAARALLREYGYASTIHIGVEKVGEGGIAGHAWLTCGNTVVTGDEGLDRYSEVHRL